MCSYLVRRGATYYFRRSIPNNLRPTLQGCSEVVVSLRTKERAVAKRLLLQRLIETERLFEEARQSMGIEPPAEPVGLHAVPHRLHAVIAPVSAVAVPEPPSGCLSKGLVKPAPALMLDEAVVDRWAAERNVQKKGQDAHRAVAQWFYERVGRKPISSIDRRDVLAFKDALIAEGQSQGNIRVKLSRLRTLMQWATDNDLVTGNAAAGIVVKDADKAANKRLPFDLASLNRIFSSPIYKCGERPIQGRGEASYWLPLLALFTGARMEELGQLRPSDITEIPYPDDEGVMRSGWFIRIVADAENGLQLKNAGSERIVPVHSQLESLGLINFAKAALAANSPRLFPLLKPNIYGRLTAKWGEWFNPYMRKTSNVVDRRLVFHSFRHTFKDYARLAGIEEGVQRQIMGHSSGDIADHYGSGHPLHQLVISMRRYKIPGLLVLA